MSRSIHTTRRTLREIQNEVASKKEGAGERLKEAWVELTRKRTLKRHVTTERQERQKPLAGTATEAIPVELLDGVNSRHGASKADVMAVLARLPHAARDGIAKIQLCPADATREQHALFPGVNCGTILGAFSRRTGLIWVHGFEVNPEALVLPTQAVDVYLRLSALKTLVHEVAHHHDRTERVRRGRWLADREENAEEYAERMAHVWTTEIVIPYLESKYPSEVKVLLDWVERQGGARLPLDFFSDDPALFLPGSYVFTRWVAELPSHLSAAAAWLSFARWIIYAGRKLESLGVADAILRTDPGFLDAQILRAEALAYLKRWDEAFQQAEHLLSQIPACQEAWRIRGEVFEARHDWRGLLENANRALSCIDQKQEAGRFAVIHRTIALCGLREDAAMKISLIEVEKLSPRRSPEALREMIFRRAGRVGDQIPE